MNTSPIGFWMCWKTSLRVPFTNLDALHQTNYIFHVRNVGHGRNESHRNSFSVVTGRQFGAVGAIPIMAAEMTSDLFPQTVSK